MFGFILSVIAGISMTLQGIFNTRLSEKIGSVETNIFVQGSGLLVTLILLLINRKQNFKNILHVNKLYLLGGILGVIILFTVMQSIKLIGTTCAIAVILIAQLSSAALTDALGLFNSSPIRFGIFKIIGLLFMLSGVVLFKIQR